MTTIEKIAAAFVALGVLASLACTLAGCPWAALTCALSAGYIAWTAGDDDEDDDLDLDTEE
jgi:hypothetical protein